MKDSYKSLFKNVGYLTISNFASKILVFLLVPLYTSILSTEEYGSYDAVVTTAHFIAPIVIANISDGVMRFLLEENNNRESIVKLGYKYLCIGIVIIGILCVGNYITHWIKFLNGYEGYAFLFATFYILNNHYTQYAKGLNRLSIMAVAGVMGTVSMLGMNILCLLVFKLGLPGFYIANICGLFIPTAYYVFKLKDWKLVQEKTIDTRLEKEMLHYSGPLIFNTIGWTINSSLDKYCVIYFLGLSASGLLAIAYKIPTILSVIYAIFVQAWQVSAVKEYSKPDYKKFYSDTFLTVNTLGAIICACLLIGNKFIARFLFAEDFYRAWQYVPFLLLSIMFNQTAGFVGPLLSAKKESKAMAKAAIAGSIANLVLNVLFIIQMGIQGAAIATAISSFVIYFVRWWFARDLLENRIYKYLYATWIVLLISAIAEISGIPFFIKIGALVVIFVINRKILKPLLNAIFRRFANAD